MVNAITKDHRARIVAAIQKDTPTSTIVKRYKGKYSVKQIAALRGHVNKA